MKSYKFKARERSGKLKEGVVRADSPQHAAHHFKEMNMVLISLKEQRATLSFIDRFSFINRIRRNDVMVFTRQMYALCQAGLPLVSGLKSLEGSTQSAAMRNILEEIRRDIEAGASFSAALAKHPRAFDGIYCSTIRAGEASGSLPEVLQRLSTALEKDHETRTRIAQALSYPIIVVVVIVLAIVILGLFVLPKFTSLFNSFGVTELPIFTRILIIASYVIRTYWYLLLAAMIAFAFAMRIVVNNPVGKQVVDRIVLRVFIFGPLYVRLCMSRFARTIATMIRSGVPIVETLDLSGRTTNNVVLLKSMDNIKEKVKEGKGIATSMSEEPMFPDMIVQMVAAGEESGRVDELMEMVADYYEREADIMIRNLTVMLEPILLVFIASIVLVLALGIFLPLWNLQSSLKM